MEFLDEVLVYAASGAGGAGHVSFRREKFVPRGGPDGGDGGRGGHVIFRATARRNTLVDYQRRRHQRAEDGRPGGKKQMTGRGGQDLECPVPRGTLIHDAETGELLADLTREGDTWVLEGGRGGLGNLHFKSSTNRTPRFAQPGEPGQERRLRLELKLLADIGLLGFPNAGKSTWLSRVSAARPKVADYPFTTLVPQLGVVALDDGRGFVVADIPGLIEGAAEGAGLGHQFLRHVERCAGYLHLVSPDTYEGDPVERYEALCDELRRYDDGVFARPQVVALSQVDRLDATERTRWVEALEAATGARVFPISSVTGEGLPEVVTALWTLVSQRRAAEAEAEAAADAEGDDAQDD